MSALIVLTHRKGRETVEIEERLSNTGPLYIDPTEVESDEEIIGRGAAGIVRKGMWLGSTEVAIKALNNVPEFTDSQELIQFYKEIVTLRFDFSNQVGKIE